MILSENFGRRNLAISDKSDFFAAGYTDENALDVVLGVSLATLCNYANNLINTPIHPELQPYALED